MFSVTKRLHFVGIGGIGMSGIAEILINQGFEVSGSDLVRSENTEYLENLGIKIFIGHDKKNIEDAEVVVYSSAVKPADNPETAEAMRLGIPLIRRAEMLAEVSRLNYTLAVSGTHGKTTTTSIIGLMLIRAGIDPTVIVGGRLKDFGGTNARLGKGNWTVVEADEYDRSFLQLTPSIAIVNNIEAEHLDIYKDFDDVKETFTEFANKVPFYGFVACCLDDDGVKDIIASINKKIVTYGLSRNCDIRADEIDFDGQTTNCKIYQNDELLGSLKIKIPGTHNIRNTLAAITVARMLDVDFTTIKESIEDFHGVYRRFDIKGETGGVMVVDDYAHHPTEVEATLQAARNVYNRRIVAVFQPHTYTRTQKLYKDFARSFDEADVLIVSDVYPAREKPIEGVDGALIADYTRKLGHRNVEYIPKLDDISSHVKKILKDGDMLITLGAGNVCNIADELIEKGF